MTDDLITPDPAPTAFAPLTLSEQIDHVNNLTSALAREKAALAEMIKTERANAREAQAARTAALKAAHVALVKPRPVKPTSGDPAPAKVKRGKKGA